MPIPIQTIRDFPLFNPLNSSTQEDIANAGFLQEYSTRSLVQIQDEPCKFVGFVYSGSAAVYRCSSDGNEQILSIITPGMHVNTVPALDADSTLRACIRAISHLMLLMIPIGDYRILLKSHADFAYLILTDFAHRLDHLIGLVDELSLHSVRGRLARFLLDQAKEDQIPRVWTQEEIAFHLGTVRDVVGRTLRAFKSAGLIDRKNGSLILLDRIGLEEEAKS
jgi:CRP-like cAMP-binding protein